MGLISCLVPLYVADCAPARFRGALVSLYQFDVGLGLLLGVIVDNATKNRNDSGAYRIPMAVQLVFPVILVPGLILFAPESPRWLLKKGKTEQARAALRRLHGNRPDVIESEILYISGTIEEERRAEGSWRELLHWHQDGRKAYLGMALQGKMEPFSFYCFPKLNVSPHQHGNKRLESISSPATELCSSRLLE